MRRLRHANGARPEHARDAKCSATHARQRELGRVVRALGLDAVARGDAAAARESDVSVGEERRRETAIQRCVC